MRSIERCLVAEIPESVRAQIDNYTFVGSTGFARVWESIGGRAVGWMMTESGSTLAALVGVEFRRRPFTRLQVMPDGCYARLYAQTTVPDERTQIAQELIAAIGKAGYARIHLADYFRELGMFGSAGSVEYVTLVVDISQPDWQPPNVKLQSEIRKAEREGVVVSEFNAANHFDAFMQLASRTEHRHGRQPRYSRDCFLKLSRLAETDKRIKWLYVEQDGHPVVSQIYFVEGATALNWQIYFDKAYSHLKANQYLMFTAARLLANSGVKYLNLGASPPEAEGLRTYKEKWGGETYRYPITTHTSWLGKLI